MDFAYAVVFGANSDDDDFSGLTVKLNRDGRRGQKAKRNLAGFFRTAVNNKAMDLFRHIASRNGGIARIDADRVPGDCPLRRKRSSPCSSISSMTPGAPPSR